MSSCRGREVRTTRDCTVGLSLPRAREITVFTLRSPRVSILSSHFTTVVENGIIFPGVPCLLGVMLGLPLLRVPEGQGMSKRCRCRRAALRSSLQGPLGSGIWDRVGVELSPRADFRPESRLPPADQSGQTTHTWTWTQALKAFTCPCPGQPLGLPGSIRPGGESHSLGRI